MGVLKAVVCLKFDNCEVGRSFAIQSASMYVNGGMNINEMNKELIFFMIKIAGEVNSCEISLGLSTLISTSKCF